MPNRLRSVAAAASSIVIVATGLLVAASPTGAAPLPGYTLERANLIGETPAGLHVYVDPSATGHAAIAAASKRISAELRRLGLPVVYAGYGNPDQVDGRIQVTTGSYGCYVAGEGRSDAVTVSYFGDAAGPDVYMSHSTITVCPSFARSAPRTSLTSALKHEFGHAMGLGHTSYTYRGRHQIMYPALQSDVTDYQAGDLRGLRALAAGAQRVRNEIPPLGRQYSTYSDGSIVFSGWSLLRLNPDRSVTITVTDNGSTVYRSASTVAWQSVNTTFHVKGRHGFSVRRPWSGGTHRYCVTATSSVDSQATADLGCVTWTD